MRSPTPMVGVTVEASNLDNDILIKEDIYYGKEKQW